VGALQPPYICGSQPQNWAILLSMTSTIVTYIQGWARSFVNIYPGTRIWTTKMTRWDISTPAYATPGCWPAQCWRIEKPNQLFTTTTRVRLPLIVIRDGTENVSRPRTQQEIPAKSRRLNSKQRFTGHDSPTTEGWGHPVPPRTGEH